MLHYTIRKCAKNSTDVLTKSDWHNARNFLFPKDLSALPDEEIDILPYIKGDSSMIKTNISLLMLFGVGLFLNSAQAAPTDSTWNLKWADECNGAANTACDGTKWNMVNSGGGFGNGELEYYTNRTANCYHDGTGNLVIKTMKESYSGSNYTSAKLYSQRKGDWTYCRVQIRAKLPKGRCVWPAFWMMPTASKYGGWPACGEMDIMEERGDNTNSVGGTIHFGNPWKYIGQSYSLPNKQTYDTAFHLFDFEWEAGEIRWYIDNTLYETRKASEWFTSGASKATAPNAPFDQDFYMQLNTAVGGSNTPYTGNQNPDDAVFPQYMYIDYVRIYQRGPVAVSHPVTQSLKNSRTVCLSVLSGTSMAKLNFPAQTQLSSLAIYNMKGELVRTLMVNASGAQTLQVQWDGKNMSGKQLAAGSYTIVAQSQNRVVQTGRIMLIK